MRQNGSQPDQGELARLLREAGSAYDPGGVEGWIGGVLAAPAEVGTSWHVLVAAPMTPALARALEVLRTAMASGYHDGLAGEDFDGHSRPERLARLREALAARGLDGVIVPRADDPQGEFVPPRRRRLPSLTGFTGSAGLPGVFPGHPTPFHP